MAKKKTTKAAAKKATTAKSGKRDKPDTAPDRPAPKRPKATEPTEPREPCRPNGTPSGASPRALRSGTPARRRQREAAAYTTPALISVRSPMAGEATAMVRLFLGLIEGGAKESVAMPNHQHPNDTTSTRSPPTDVTARPHGRDRRCASQARPRHAGGGGRAIGRDTARRHDSPGGFPAGSKGSPGRGNGSGV
ncbi:hypothetical protein [Streptomyces sp. NPDC001930]|uniref:hypothetical protein n=1 Tax=Streptomyces sp. NPDC001930 TaxID=3364625 RepID=UPI0036A00D0E